MIQNIVFDLGNVLITFNPLEFLKDRGYSQEATALINQEIYQSREWVELDLGNISRSEAIQRIVLRNPEHAELLTGSFFIDELLVPIDENVHLLEKLKKKYSLYYLTNYHAEAFSNTKARYTTVFTHFIGGVVSSHINLVKPNPTIYSSLLERYQLKPEETLYIDDLAENVKTATDLGMHTIHLLKPENLAAQLQGKIFTA